MKLLAGLAINSILCAISQYGQRLCAAKLALSLIMPSTPPIHPILTINVSHWPLLTRILQRGRTSQNEEMTMVTVERSVLRSYSALEIELWLMMRLKVRKKSVEGLLNLLSSEEI